MTTQSALSASISEIGNYDFSGEWKTDIYLDPEARRLYTFTDTNCFPVTAYHSIDQLILTVYPTAIASSVESHLKSIESTLLALLDEYQGSEWNGSNHIGQWSLKGKELMEYLDQLPVEIASYWEPNDWFEPVISELKAKWESGMTAQQIIDSEHCGDDADGQCDPTKAVGWLEDLIEEWEADA